MMPFGSEGIDKNEIGLALSGGGFRAALFHIGSLWRLCEIGALSKLTRISSVSGGSIVNGVLASRWGQLASDFSVQNYATLVVNPLREFCKLQIDAPSVAEGIFSPWSSAGQILERKYSEHLFSIGLHQLPEKPRFVFNATNIQTGRDFRFSKPYMGD
jgi:NTE family protein